MSNEGRDGEYGAEKQSGAGFLDCFLERFRFSVF
jgi:hypothetical protein